MIIKIPKISSFIQSLWKVALAGGNTLQGTLLFPLAHLREACLGLADIQHSLPNANSTLALLSADAEDEIGGTILGHYTGMYGQQCFCRHAQQSALPLQPKHIGLNEGCN